MNIAFWILRVLLALHTLAGAAWKFSKSAGETMPSLAAIPNGVWHAMSILEILCAILLVIPAINPALSRAPSAGAIIIAIEMLAFCGIHIASGNLGNVGPMVYWLVVAIMCVAVVYLNSALLK